MSLPKLGVVLRADDAFFRNAKKNDPCDVVVLRSCLLNPPRRAAAIELGKRIRKLYPNIEIWPLVWHYVSHRKEDGLVDQASRTLNGVQANFGHMQDSSEVRAAWETTKALCEHLEATGVVLRTPPSFSPGSLGQSRMASFAGTVKAADLRMLWEPDGLWTVEPATALAKMLDVEVAFSASSSSPGDLVDGEAPGHWAKTWLRVDAELRPDQAEILVAEAVAELGMGSPGPTHIICDGPRAHANLRMLGRELSHY